MAVYVDNSQVIIPSSGGNYTFSVEVDGGPFKNGKQVVSWSNVRTNVSWLTCYYDEGQVDDGDYHYYFYGVASAAISTTTIRSGMCYADYVLVDGTTGTMSVFVRQQGDVGITTDVDNPLVFPAGGGIETITTLFEGVSSSSSIKDVDISGPWGVSEVAGGDVDNDFGIDYKVSTLYSNVDDSDVTGYIQFSYFDADDNFTKKYYQYITQTACPYPFGLKQIIDGVETDIPTNGNLKMIVDIPFTGGTVVVGCNYPFGWQAEKTFTPWNEGSSTMTNGVYTEFSTIVGFYETYNITFTSNTSVNQRFADLVVEYYSDDGVLHTDTVRFRQQESDGSNIDPYIIPTITKVKVKADGTPEMYDFYRVRYVGDMTPKTPEVLNDVDWIHIGEGTVVSGAGTFNQLIEYPVEYDENLTSSPRTGYVRFESEEFSDIQGLITVIQAKYVLPDTDPEPEIPVEGDEYIGPLWKDVEYNLGAFDVVNYTIYKDGVLIFSGRSCKRPNEEYNKILVNKICQNYIDVPELAEGESGEGYGEFELRSSDENTLYRVFKFVNDWSYSDYFSTGLLSHPILNNRKVVYGQLLPFTVWGAAEEVAVEYGIRYKDGYTDEYGEVIEDWGSTVYATNRMVTTIFPYSGRNYKDGVDGYYIGENEYVIDYEECECPYVIYYLNPWGGYDWFNVTGVVNLNDNLTQHTYSQNYNNTTIEFGKRRYLSEINREYSVTTQWLKQDESDRMWYLLESNTVYLHNIKEDKIIPVVVKDTSVEHKKKNRNNKIIQYTFTLEESQTRERI